MSHKSVHQQQVEEFMRLAKQSVPEMPVQSLSPEERILRAKLIMEEALETIEALGVDMWTEDEDGNCCGIEMGALSFTNIAGAFNLVDVIDGCCDLAIVTTGTLSACGVPDLPFQDLVNQSKLIKPPDIAGLLVKVTEECRKKVVAETEAEVDRVLGNLVGLRSPSYPFSCDPRGMETAWKSDLLDPATPEPESIVSELTAKLASRDARLRELIEAAEWFGEYDQRCTHDEHLATAQNDLTIAIVHARQELEG